MVRRKADDERHKANYELEKMKQLAEYNKLSMISDDELKKLYQNTKLFTAPKGMGKTIGIQPEPFEEPPKLKVYEVTVHVERPYPYKTASTHREIIVTVLAKDSTDAMSYAETSQGVTRMEDMAKSTWTEIGGPFKNGFILAARHG